MDMIHVSFGAVFLSIVHALMPDHWIPIVMISRTEKRSRTETSWITALIAIPHIISTILIGILIGIIGYKISSAHEFVMRVTAPLILIVIGLIYVALDFKDDSKHHHKDYIKTDSL